MAVFVLRFTPLSYTKSAGNASGMAWGLTPLERSEFYWTEKVTGPFLSSGVCRLLPMHSARQCGVLQESHTSVSDLL